MQKLIIVVFFLISTQVFSQQKLSVNIVERPSSLGIEPAFETSIPKADMDKAEDLFNNFISQKQFLGLIRKKTANQKKGHEWITKEFTLKAVSENPMVVLFQISNFTNQTYIRFFFQKKNGFLGAEDIGSEKEIANAKKFVSDYAAELYRETVKDEIQVEKRKLSKLKRKHDKLEKKNKDINRAVDANRQDKIPKHSTSGYVDVEKATDQANKFLKDEKKGQNKIRRNQKKQAELKAEMKNEQVRIKKLQDELNLIE